MTNMLCKDCKFWKQQSIDSGICDRITHCNIPKNRSFEIDASADDDSNLQTELVTAPEFGCVNFEKKVKPND